MADALRLRVAPYQPKTYTTSERAYDRFLQGVFAHRRMTSQDVWKALQFYREGYEEDPSFGLAHAISANAYLNLSSLGLDRHVAFRNAREHALTALAIDSTLAEGLVALATILIWHDRQLEAGADMLRRALILYPTLPQAHSRYGGYLLATGGDPDRAVARARRALELDPLNAGRSQTVERYLYHARRYDDVLAQSSHTRALAPDGSAAIIGATRADALRELGRQDDAIAEYRRLMDATDGRTPPGLLVAHARAGRADQARRLLPGLEARAVRGEASGVRLAGIHAALGDADTAFRWLERDLDDRSPAILDLHTDPELDPLREDPRFRDLVLRAGLPLLPEPPRAGSGTPRPTSQRDPRVRASGGNGMARGDG